MGSNVFIRKSQPLNKRMIIKEWVVLENLRGLTLKYEREKMRRKRKDFCENFQGWLERAERDNFKLFTVLREGSFVNWKALFFFGPPIKSSPGAKRRCLLIWWYVQRLHFSVYPILIFLPLYRWRWKREKKKR